MKDDLVLVLPDLHGDLEQLGDDRRWLRLRQLGVLECRRSQFKRLRQRLVTLLNEK
jgi:hypothetical protein